MTEGIYTNKPLEALLDACVDGIVISDHTGSILRFNKAAQRLFGYTEAEVTGRNVRILMPHPDQEKHDGYLRRYLDTNKPAIIGIGREVSGLRADGRTFPLHLSVGEITGQQAARFVAIVHDLSEQKATQGVVKQLETHLAHADRLVMLGELTAGIGHEINQPLTAIAAFADAASRLLKSDLPDSQAELENVLHRIAEQARRAGNVVNRLRGLSRRGELTKSSQRLDQLVQNVLLLFEHELKTSSITLHTSLEPNLPLLIVDEIQIQQVLVNLIKNAIDSLQASGGTPAEIHLEARIVEQQVLIQVRDNGQGVPPELVAHLFEPFFTTKTRGVGLGLSICKNIAIAHGGNLAYRKARNAGAEFTLSLPLTYIG